MRRSRRILLALLLAPLLVVGLGRTEAVADSEARTLRSPWNLVAAFQSGAVSEIVAGIPEVQGLFRWDSERQQFDSWIRDAPAFLNTLGTVRVGDGRWVWVNAEALWPLPEGEQPIGTSQTSGWALIGWTEAETDAAVAVQRLAATRLIGFDAATQEFRRYDPDLPPSLNTLARIQRGEAVWALLEEAALAPIGLAPALSGRSFDQPIELGAYPGDRLFVAEQDGLVLLFDRDGGGESVLLDLRSRVSRVGGEEGLLSVALDPDFAENGFLYAYYSVAGAQRTRLSRFPVERESADVAGELTLLEIEQPFRNHNGGAVRFGPDGFLYLSVGDGGSGGDPLANGQNTGTLLGSILRLDVRDASPAQPYRLPADNPLVDVAGARPEIWAYGFRNPWRMAFDPLTGSLWAGDVGQDAVEEVDSVRAGGNYGWNRLEGDRCFPPAQGCDAAGTIAPVATYGHDQGCSITGGVVYRGSAVPAIARAYLYADFCSGRIWALRTDGASDPVVVAESGASVASFGIDASGEVYVLQFGGPLLRIVPAE